MTSALTSDGKRVFDLEQPRFQGMPVHPAHEPGYLYTLYNRHSDGWDPDRDRGLSGSSGVLVTMEHAGTHIDAICHIAEDQFLYGGIHADSIDSETGYRQLGIHEVAPIVAPGVLLDVAGYRGVDSLPSGERVRRRELEAVAAAQGVTIVPGSVALVRIGNDRNWGDAKAYLAAGGMDADASQWLADLGVRAVGADNMAWDVLGWIDPELNTRLPGHVILLARSGIHIIENLVLSELAEAETYTFQFICTPLKLTGATGSPVRPIAIA
jgi:kynurenine formamidase